MSTIVGILYDERMLLHIRIRKTWYECPGRVQSIMKELEERGLAGRCRLIDCSRFLATDETIESVHHPEHINYLKSLADKCTKDIESMSDEKFDIYSVYLNKKSDVSARVAAECTLQAAEMVGEKTLNSAFAIVRPPGHHATNIPDPEDKDGFEGRGFCIYNNVAIAATSLRQHHKDCRIATIDWDVHHGDGTQSIFYDDPNVLFFSVHRYDPENFYPYSEDGNFTKTGEGEGAGFNINVPFPFAGLEDVDLLLVWKEILIPVLLDFSPDFIIISAGFDAAKGDDFGECNISPSGYATLLRELMKFASGRIVAVLEGGYDLPSLSTSVSACVATLLKDDVVEPVGEPIQKVKEVVYEVQEHICSQFGSTWVQLRKRRDERLGVHVAEELVEVATVQSTILDSAPTSASPRPRRKPRRSTILDSAQTSASPRRKPRRSTILDSVQTSASPRRKPRRSTKSAGLIFPVGRVPKCLQRVVLGRKITVDARVYLIAVLQDLTSKLLSLAGEVTKGLKKKRIKANHIELAIRGENKREPTFKGDEELQKLLQDVIFPRSLC